jgi:hypothetical protein
MSTTRGVLTHSTSRRCLVEGNVLEHLFSASRRTEDAQQRKWIRMDVLLALFSGLPPSPNALAKWTIYTSLSKLALMLGINRGGYKTNKVREALTYLNETPIRFERFLQLKPDGSKEHVVLDRPLLEVTFANVTGGYRPRTTVAVKFAPEIVQNLQQRYFKVFPFEEYARIRWAAFPRSHFATYLYFYLLKKNQPQWCEDEAVLYERLGIEDQRPARARSYVIRAGQVLDELGRVKTEYDEGKRRYSFRLRMFEGTTAAAG